MTTTVAVELHGPTAKREESKNRRIEERVSRRAAAGGLSHKIPPKDTGWRDRATRG
jgi:hypothetical protein